TCKLPRSATWMLEMLSSFRPRTALATIRSSARARLRATPTGYTVFPLAILASPLLSPIQPVPSTPTGNQLAHHFRLLNNRRQPFIECPNVTNKKPSHRIELARERV